MSQYLRAERRGPERLAEFLQDCQEDKIDLTYDRLACEALKQSDVVLYVADANNPVVDAHTQDVRVIQKIQPRIVAILNKTKTLTETKGEEAKYRRIEQWKKNFVKWMSTRSSVLMHIGTNLQKSSRYPRLI
ncbi:MAG: hypothetical protein GDA38_27220 [Hormoscilla sp. SP12CHS1]|nr:hypothetical protein [Hormoscilla sp. SP12CHS1]